MAKDYVKYISYSKSRENSNRFWILLALFFVLACLAVSLFFFNSDDKQKITRQAENRLKQKILSMSSSKIPTPQFDFYNILPKTDGVLSSNSVR